MTKSGNRTDAGLELDWIETLYSPPDGGARLLRDRPGDRTYHGMRLVWLSIDGERTQGLMRPGAEGRALEWISGDRNRHHR